jgi:hypothetical protein
MQRLKIKTTINEGYFFFGSAPPNPAGPVANQKKPTKFVGSLVHRDVSVR